MPLSPWTDSFRCRFILHLYTMGFRKRFQPAVKTAANGPQLEALPVAVQLGEDQRGFGLAFCNGEY
ncbi:hypothetical protein D3C73_1020510 [compost metagenome]